MADCVTAYPPFMDVATLPVSGNKEIWSTECLLRIEEETGNSVN